MPSNLYPDGLQHLSDPNPITLTWDFNAPSGKTVSNYSFTFGQEADLSDGYTINTTTKSVSFYNAYLGRNYYRLTANYSDSTNAQTDIRHFDVDGAAPRNLRIDGMTNCRDMGGRATEDGGMVKQGLIFRTSGTNGWGNNKAVIPDNITSAGREELLNHLGVKTEINVNTSGSNQVGVQNFQGCFMDYQGGKHHLSRNVEPLKKVFHVLSDPNNYPVFYHCRIGTDRTGLCAIMISGLLGIPENEISKITYSLTLVISKKRDILVMVVLMISLTTLTKSKPCQETDSLTRFTTSSLALVFLLANSIALSIF